MQMVLLISCPDQPGIVARFSGLLFSAQTNVLALEQHVENDNWFFMRIHAELDTTSAQSDLKDNLIKLCAELNGTIQIHNPQKKQRVAILASSDDSCTRELIVSQQTGRLPAEIVGLISNYSSLETLAQQYGVSFTHVSTRDGMEGAERTMLELLRKSSPDLIVLARYMKVLSPKFVDTFNNRIINIHHGFLPAFKGNRPYHQAWERGVKVIGATAHFVTADLDAGPIIAQEVIPVTHQHAVQDMIQSGQDIEKRVLLQAVQAYLQHKIILHNGRTIIFH